jgi:hypothetical protein
MDAPLPKPPTEDQGTNGTNDHGATPRTVPVNNENKEDDDDENDDSEDHVEQADEQKVRVEDLERHKVILSPTQPESEPEFSKHTEKDEEVEAEGQRTPGDASFQDVAL